MANTQSNVAKSIIQGLEEAVHFEKSKEKKYGRSIVVNFSPLPHYTSSQIKNIRNEIGLTQKSFAFLMGVSQKTVEAWETGTNEPNGTARRMLSLLKQEKELVKKFELVPTH